MDATQAAEVAHPGNPYTLIIPSITGDHVLATVLPTEIVQLPLVRWPLDVKIETMVATEFGIRVHVVRFWSDMLYELFPSLDSDLAGGNAGSRGSVIVVMDILDEYPNVREPLQWVSRDRALNGKWIYRMRGFDVSDLIAQCFGEKKGEVHWKESQPWFSAGWFTNISQWIGRVVEDRNMVPEANKHAPKALGWPKFDYDGTEM